MPTDESLLHWAQSYAQAPTLELQGARQDSESYARAPRDAARGGEENT